MSSPTFNWMLQLLVDLVEPAEAHPTYVAQPLSNICHVCSHDICQIDIVNVCHVNYCHVCMFTFLSWRLLHLDLDG